LIEASIATNAGLAAFSMEQEFVASAWTLGVAYGVYVVESREIWAPRAEEIDGGATLVPRDSAGFSDLGDAIARSDRIASLLKQENS
jgi:carbonic anhydrase